MEFKELMEKVAKKHGTTALEVYSEIQKVIDVGMKDSDEEVQKNWLVVRQRQQSRML